MRSQTPRGILDVFGWEEERVEEVGGDLESRVRDPCFLEGSIVSNHVHQ